MGVSVNRWEPDNVLNTLRTNLIDTVQVIYNIFDQAPDDNLFPLCKDLNIGVIARVPFDEGSLTGMLSNSTTFPPDDWRATGTELRHRGLNNCQCYFFCCPGAYCLADWLPVTFFT